MSNIVDFIHNSDTESIRLEIKNNNLNIFSMDKENRSLLHLAIIHKKYEVLEWINSVYGIKCMKNLSDNYGKKPIDYTIKDSIFEIFLNLAKK